MNFTQYAPLALRTAKQLASPELDLRHCAIGLVTELGELATIVKRIEIYDKPIADEMRAHALEEAGDAQWYVPLGLRAIMMPADIVHYPQIACPSFGSMGAAVRHCAALAGKVCMQSDAYWRRAEDRAMLGATLMQIVEVLDVAIAPAFGFTGDQARSDNIIKLRFRFPDAFSNAAAEARADKGGADARSS